MSNQSKAVKEFKQYVSNGFIWNNEKTKKKKKRRKKLKIKPKNKKENKNKAKEIIQIDDSNINKKTKLFYYEKMGSSRRLHINGYHFNDLFERNLAFWNRRLYPEGEYLYQSEEGTRVEILMSPDTKGVIGYNIYGTLAATLKEELTDPSCNYMVVLERVGAPGNFKTVDEYCCCRHLKRRASYDENIKKKRKMLTYCIDTTDQKYAVIEFITGINPSCRIFLDQSSNGIEKKELINSGITDNRKIMESWKVKYEDINKVKEWLTKQGYKDVKNY